MKPKLLVICGPTATGKTAIGITLAKTYNGEILSADSRQVYREMDIITGKDVIQAHFNTQHANVQQHIQEQLKRQVIIGTYNVEGVPVWGLDLVEPDQPFDISTYVTLSKLIIKDIVSRGKLPIIVGGTGFYIKGLLKPIETVGIPSNSKLRQELEQLTKVQLQELLQHEDRAKWELMNNSDRSNPRRLIRALEVAAFKKTQNYNSEVIAIENEFDVQWIGLTADKNMTEERIHNRVEVRIAMGAEEEVKGLLKKGYDWSLPSMSAIGYKEWKEYLDGKKTEEEVIDLWKLHEVQYAKRQMTWFKKEKQVLWFNIDDINYLCEIKLHIQNWLKNS